MILPQVGIDSIRMQVLMGLSGMRVTTYCKAQATIWASALLLGMILFQPAYGASVSLDYTLGNGGITVSATATFESCKIYYPDGITYRVENGGSVTVWRDAAEICHTIGSGSVTCTAPTADTGCTNGLMSLVARAYDNCPSTETGNASQDLTFNNTPSIKIAYPADGSTISSGFSLIANAAFTPEMSDWKGP